MWPAGLMTPNVEWDEKEQVYFITEETQALRRRRGHARGRGPLGDALPGGAEGRAAALLGRRAARGDARAASCRSSSRAARTGREEARATYDRLLRSARRALSSRTSSTTAISGAQTVSVTTPDPRLDAAFAWAKVGIDKGLVDQPAARHRPARGLPHLGRQRAARASPGSSAATRSGPPSPRPPTATAPTTRLALDFLRVYQRERRQDPPRDLAERLADPVVRRTTSTRGTAPTPRRST